LECPSRSIHFCQKTSEKGLVVSHKFYVGQIVDLAPRMLQAAARGQYEVRQLMPSSDRDADDPSYRIKSLSEKHERVASESDLTLSTSAHALAD
jgi:hypothetical protein